MFCAGHEVPQHWHDVVNGSGPVSVLVGHRLHRVKLITSCNLYLHVMCELLLVSQQSQTWDRCENIEVTADEFNV